MIKNDVVRLVKTLSSAEKRYLKLYCKKQSVSRAYLLLFDLIDQTPLRDMELLEQKFGKTNPETSFDTTAKYLMRVITDCLIQLRIDKDSLFQQMQTFMRAKVLLDRSLIKEGMKELHKAKKLAEASQNYYLEYLAYRAELNVFADLNFREVTEEAMIEMQMKARNLLKSQFQIHEHHSLYELLKFRLINIGRSLSEHHKKQLNDLLLSELSLVTNKVAHNFESKKLHLLFQSFFFTSIGDYKSALKTFSELNELFEINIHILGDPPYDYLSALEGIMDSLRTIKAYDRIEFYINKVGGLIRSSHTEQFNLQATKTAITFRLTLFNAEKKYKEALNYIKELPADIIKETIIVDYEKHCELLFYMAAAHFGLNEWEKSLKYLNKITLLEKSNPHFPIYKAARLLAILAHYEMGNNEYLQYEIRSYKRSAKYKTETLKTEKLIFKTVMLHPNRNSVVKNKLLLKKLQPSINAVLNDKFEMQILKFFDFAVWIETKFTATKQPKARSIKESKPAA
ncbi:hypothetical protein EOD41_03655 [Mucilaginibacter limnophilus]|uniref:Tetratricopeptide repeat protein n=1 Tax=Mucilaginibacter limnophilus TaxID=1932778 RepID=A0A3S2VAT6_9SPHI|nr:hypothetical protein [Mucilaginibacter limnophilus]RVU03042.1 hypothetical protein EOD41_03655 [Mucilaginibacter limnophilus]